MYLPIVCSIDSFVAAAAMAAADCPGTLRRAAIAGFAAFDMLAGLTGLSLGPAAATPIILTAMIAATVILAPARKYPALFLLIPILLSADNLALGAGDAQVSFRSTDRWRFQRRTGSCGFRHRGIGETIGPEHIPGGGPMNVTTRSYNAARTGANTAETILTPAKVGSNILVKALSLHFGDDPKLNDDPRLEAQPLYVSKLRMHDGSTHDVVFVYHGERRVWAFSAADGKVLWRRTWAVPSSRLPSPIGIPRSDRHRYVGREQAIGHPQHALYRYRCQHDIGCSMDQS